ncbi:MAG: hypoxanthine phosphoribosyltransferase [Actinobacteria bacterium]|nr:hypoxanthine phosphoribosyltransferase [Actinomycetota bacterium]
MNEDIGEILITEDEIQAKVAELGKAITEDYRGRDLLLVGVLKGAFILMSDLARAIPIPLEFDFMAVASYGSATKSSGVVRILKDLDLTITGRNVLIVEDIIDSGLTLSYLIRNLQARGPATLEVCALLDKPDVQKVPIDVRYHGFSLPPVFVVGYGLDYVERYRNLPYVGTLKPHLYTDEGGPWHAPSGRP